MTTTLLGVDDSKTMRKVIEITFAGEDYKTVLAANADDAMSKLQAERPSLVLLDAALEGTNGYDLCQRLKAAAPNVAVVLLASKQQPYDRARGAAVGADDFVDKPFDTQQLLDKVGTLLRRQPGAAAAAPAPAPAVNLTATAHGLGPAPAPVGVPLTAAARPVSPELGARGRTATLAYGQNPMGGAGPVAPLIPAPSGAAVPRSSPVAAAPPFPPATPAAKPNLTPAPAPVAAAPAPAPAAVAAPVAAAVANGADFSQKLANIGLTKEQVTAVLALSREVVEKVVWEVVPTLAETLIKEEIQRLTRE